MTNKELIIGFFMEGYVHHNYDFLMDHMAADYFDNSPCAARTNLECVNILKGTEQIFPDMQVDIHKEQVLINQCVEKITKLLFLFQSVLSEVVQMPSAPLSDGLYIIVIQSQIRDIVVTVELVPKAVARIIYVFLHCCVLRLCI